jgi:hypothetical protein
LTSRDSIIDISGPEFIALLNSKKIVVANGFHFRNVDKFFEYSDAIKDYFLPIDEHRHNVGELIGQVREDCNVLIGVHIRRKDYQEWRGGKYYYEIKDFLRIMQSAQALFPRSKVTFLVCSNEDISLEDFASCNIALGSGHFVEDLYSFAQCDYLIGPPSSYTVWASFFGKVPLYIIMNPEMNISLESFVLGSETVRWMK